MGPEAKVISNAGHLMVFAKLNLLYLLPELYGKVLYTDSVYRELVIEGMHQGYEDARMLKTFLERENWLPEYLPSDPVSSDLNESSLDRGERDTIFLAYLLKIDLVLMDEQKGREFARSLGLTVKGSLGVLMEAYHRGMVGKEQLQLNLYELTERRDIWINPKLIEQALVSLG
jgi:predicted nucleic acid-binding protein